MPVRDGTGPQGQGAMTGRGLGSCGVGFARDRGYGMEKGFGSCCGCCPMCGLKPSKEDEKAMLEREKKAVDERLEELNKE